MRGPLLLLAFSLFAAPAARAEEPAPPETVPASLEEAPGTPRGASFLWPSSVLGVGVTEPTPELRNHLGGSLETGLLVLRVYDETPAEKAGIQVGDLIVSLAGEPVDSVTTLQRFLAGHAGQVFTMEVIREKAPAQLDVRLPERGAGTVVFPLPVPMLDSSGVTASVVGRVRDDLRVQVDEVEAQLRSAEEGLADLRRQVEAALTAPSADAEHEAPVVDMSGSTQP